MSEMDPDVASDTATPAIADLLRRSSWFKIFVHDLRVDKRTTIAHTPIEPSTAS